jgi:hypothetical protein
MATVKQVVGRAYNDYLQKGLGNHSPSEAMWIASEYLQDQKELGQPITEESLYKAVFDQLIATDG